MTQPMGRVGASGRIFEERCLRHRELDGHATPGWVLRSAARRSWLTYSGGVSYEFRALAVNFRRSSLTC